MSSVRVIPPEKSKATWAGSITSTRQIAHTVKDGRKVHFRTVVGDVSGYVAGMDAYHWLVVSCDESEVTTHLVHKSAALVTLSRTSTLRDEPAAEEMDRIIAPFRKRVLEDHFGHAATT